MPETGSQLIDTGVIVLHEGKTFHQYTDVWDERPKFVVPLAKLTDKPAQWHHSLRFYRVAMRMIASSTNERTSIFTILPPGVTVGHSVGIDQNPSLHPNSSGLILAAIANTYTFDWGLRQAVGANVTLFLVRQALWPNQITSLKSFFTHAVLRLVCNHFGYSDLWHDQLGDSWSEKQPPFTWPVLTTDERWQVRACIDAVVADSYGLNRERYAHVLSTFSHKSYPKAPQLCLAMFDELQTIGIDAFTKKYDPYWDIPLNENLPKPVIDLPIPAAASAGAAEQPTLFADADVR